MLRVVTFLLVSYICCSVEAARQPTITAVPFDGPHIRNLVADLSLTIDGNEVAEVTLDRNATVTYEATIGRRGKLRSLEMEVLPYGYHQGNYSWNNVTHEFEPVHRDLFVSIFLVMPAIDFQIIVWDGSQYQYSGLQAIDAESLLDHSSLTVGNFERERNQIDTNGRRDFWHLSNIEGPFITSQIELYHEILGGKEVILTLEEFGYLPTEHISLVSPSIRRGGTIPEPSTLMIVSLLIWVGLFVKARS